MQYVKEEQLVQPVQMIILQSHTYKTDVDWLQNKVNYLRHDQFLFQVFGNLSHC